MAYKTFDIEGKEIVQHDLQDKGDWCGKGAGFEEVFIGRYPHLGLMINPQKQNNIYAPDLSYIENGTYADLKTQNTHFFSHSPDMGSIPSMRLLLMKRTFCATGKIIPESMLIFGSIGRRSGSWAQGIYR